ncbi:uncharacterized protein LOC122008520 [Zingiber officinale]|uniref:uncharacterized protein LOC122008520 n=1 Tax=Zingiber officinale TaxID=94328 RepID=UPI001C4D716A|nr:uncharacterized protein LOC122008520 [Zingiber officinale]
MSKPSKKKKSRRLFLLPSSTLTAAIFLLPPSPCVAPLLPLRIPSSLAEARRETERPPLLVAKQSRLPLSPKLVAKQSRPPLLVATQRHLPLSPKLVAKQSRPPLLVAFLSRRETPRRVLSQLIFLDTRAFLSAELGHMIFGILKFYIFLVILARALFQYTIFLKLGRLMVWLLGPGWLLMLCVEHGKRLSTLAKNNMIMKNANKGFPWFYILFQVIKMGNKVELQLFALRLLLDFVMILTKGNKIGHLYYFWCLWFLV